MRTYTLQQFQEAASRFVVSLQPFQGRATVVGLYGDLGSGKTTFVQAAAHALGVSETVNSPTFLIMKKFPIPNSLFQILIHIDAYRLKHSDELRKLRFSELLADPSNLVLIEWADRVADLLPEDHHKLQFELVDDATRRLTS